ncbi:MAG: twin-arginine translocation signal domain-containing protein [Candidatus Acidiferrales bacterium]
MKQPDVKSRRGFLQASSMLGLAVAFGSATIGEAFADSKSKTTEGTMSEGSATQRSSEQSADGIADSPIGLAAWIIDHDVRSYELITRVFSGQSEGLTRDDILDNITLYWLTNTAISSARLYWEYKGGFFDVRGITIPVAVSAFPDEIYQAPKSWSEKAYPKLIYYNRPPKGGHFAAWEQPQVFSEELRLSFKSLRS